MTATASPHELGYEPIGEGAGAFPLPEPHKDDLTALNFSGVDHDRAFKQAADAPGAASSVIDTEADVVVPAIGAGDGSTGKVVKITQARGFVSTGDIVPDETRDDEGEGSRPNLSVVAKNPSPSKIDAAPLSRKKLLAYAAAGVLALGGTAAVITDGFGTFGPTKQNIERVKEKQQKILDKLKK